MTPLLKRIEQDLKTCADPLQRAELLAERGCYLARIGDFAGAGEVLSSLRSAYGDGRHARISVWMMLIEGLVLFYENMSLECRDRVLRAHSISVAAHLDDLGKLTAAWLALIEFNRLDFRAMEQSLQHCLAPPTQATGQWQCRAFLVLADAFMYSGERKSAQAWYERTRQCAVETGDEAALSALIYNRAVSGLGLLRVASVFGPVDIALVELMSIEISSAYYFQLGVRHFSLSHLMDATRARILLMQGKFDDARAILQMLVVANKKCGFNSDQSIISVEYVFCLDALGKQSEALEVFHSIDPMDYARMSVDDQIVFLDAYLKIGERLEILQNQQLLQQALNGCKQAYFLEIADLKSILGKVTSSFS